jgi:putative endonuclease
MLSFVYIIESEKDGNFYIGRTNNLERRLKEHNNGENKSTKPSGHWRLIYYEACLDERDAIRRERYLKTSQGSRLLKARIKEYLYSRRS